MEVRRAERRDFQALCRLYGQVDAWHQQHYPEHFKFSGQRGRALGLVQKDFSNPSGEIWVVEVEGEVRGLGYFIHQETPPHPLVVARSYLLVDVVVVDEGWRGKGLGKALLGQAEDIAREQGYPAIQLKVYRDNETAIQAYEKAGFRTVRQTMELKLGSGEEN